MKMSLVGNGMIGWAVYEIAEGNKTPSHAWDEEGCREWAVLAGRHQIKYQACDFGGPSVFAPLQKRGPEKLGEVRENFNGYFWGEHHKINELISLFGHLYKKIGLFIIIVGVVISCFFPIIFDSLNAPLTVVYYTYYTFLFGMCLNFFFNYY